MTKRLPTYGRALTQAVAKDLIEPAALSRVLELCPHCDEPAPDCRCPRTWVDTRPLWAAWQARRKGGTL